MKLSQTDATGGAYLALDQGGHGSRAFLFAEHGGLLAQAHTSIATQRSGADRVEHDAQEVADSLATAAGQALQCAVEAGFTGEILAAGLATQRSSIVCWDRVSRRALSPVLSWQDRRAAGSLASLAPRAEEIRALSGLPLSPHYGASKMRWCVENLPAVKRAATQGRLRVGPLASFLAASLSTADAVQDIADPANASRTQLLDLACADWSPVLLEAFGIERDWLPAVGGTRALHGYLKLPGRRTPLQVVTGDQSAVPFAWEAPRESDIYLNIGTGAFIQRCVGARARAAPPLLSSVLRIDAQASMFSLEGTVNGAASALEQFAAQHATDVAALWGALGTQADVRVGGVHFLNGVAGLGSPWWRSDFRSEFVGSGALLERFVAVLESITFLIRANYELLERVGAPARVIVTGGLANSDWLCQRLASVLSLPLTRPVEIEATVLGVLGLLAARRPGAVSLQAGRSFAPLADAALQTRYREWRALMDAAAR
ncbi:MAG TPA: FGGY family carbohydrate kinase [Steroidobacteraceae bacterium]